MDKKKIMVSLVLGLFLIGFVSSYICTTSYSRGCPENIDKPNIPMKEEISKDEWNKIFEDYRNGILTREEAAARIKEVKIKW